MGLLTGIILLAFFSFGSTSQPLSPLQLMRTPSPLLSTESSEDTKEQTEVSLKQAIAIVDKRKLNECVARSICELSCDPESYGAKGKTVYKTLKQFESDTLPQLAYYKEASNRGKNLKSNCKECYTFYVNCKTKTESLLRLASALKVKS